MTRFMLALIALLVGSPRALATPPAGPGASAGAASTARELTAEVQALFRVAACAGDAALDPRFDRAVVDAHCEALGKIVARYQKDWLAPAQPFFAELVPSDVPTTVVYPFAGGDLLTALAVFPNISEITTISLEAGGDARAIFQESAKDLRRHLALHREFLAELVTWNHNRTLDLKALERTPLPSQLIFALVGLAVHGYEPVTLRAITLEPDGSLHHLSAADFTRIDEEVAGLRGGRKNGRLNALLANYELVFRKKGETRERIYRHFQQNLHDSHLADDARILRHLDLKARVTGMTKAASHLLWHNGFSKIRDWLKAHIAWMVSDSTGINPLHLDPERWEQTVYGKFDAAVFNPTHDGQVALRALFKSQPYRPLPMKLFGYPTKSVKGLLIVTKPRS